VPGKGTSIVVKLPLVGDACEENKSADSR